MVTQWWQTTFLALIQGLTEFLPISSSAHLILPSAVLGWPDQGLAFDVAVHLGSLLAVILYFRKDLLQLLSGCLLTAKTRSINPDSRLVLLLALATLPVVLAGLGFKSVIENQLRGVLVIAVSTIVFGVFLWLADRRSQSSQQIPELTWQIALVIGLSQVVALIPGTSRSGITMTAALFCGLDRVSASRFSFLLSIPVIGAAALLLLLDLYSVPEVNWLQLGYGLIIAAISAYVCIRYFLPLLRFQPTSVSGTFCCISVKQDFSPLLFIVWCWGYFCFTGV